METTGPQRAAFAYMINKGRGVYVGDVPRTGLRALLNDADRLAAIERRIQKLADDHQRAADDPNTTIIGEPEDIYRDFAHALRAILDPEEG